MKIRNGFVSNSSSTSFCILGIKLPYNSELEPYEYVNKMGKIYSYNEGICDISGTILGIDVHDINTTKSINEIKLQIQKDLKIKIELDVKLEEIKFFVDGGYDG